MPFVFLALGILAVVIGARGQASTANALLQSEFTGKNSFIQWFLAIVILGAIGYYKPVRPVADAMLGLVIVALILSKGNPNSATGGFFANLESAFQTAQPTPQTKVSAQNGTPGASPSIAPVGGASSFTPSQTNTGTQTTYPGGLYIPQNITGILGNF